MALQLSLASEDGSPIGIIAIFGHEVKDGSMLVRGLGTAPHQYNLKISSLPGTGATDVLALKVVGPQNMKPGVYSGQYSIDGKDRVFVVTVPGPQPLTAYTLPNTVHLTSGTPYLYWLFGGLSGGGTVDIRMLNLNPEAYEITKAELLLVSQNGEPVSPSSFTFTGPPTLLPNATGVLDFGIIEGELPAGVYTGHCRVYTLPPWQPSDLAGVTLDVRHPPIWGLIALGIGLLLGLSAFYLRTPKEVALYSIGCILSTSGFNRLPAEIQSVFRLQVARLKARATNKASDADSSLSDDIARTYACAGLAVAAQRFLVGLKSNGLTDDQVKSIEAEAKDSMAAAASDNEDDANQHLHNAEAWLAFPGDIPSEQPNVKAIPAPLSASERPVVQAVVELHRSDQGRGLMHFVRFIDLAKTVLTLLGVSFVAILGFQLLYVNVQGFGHSPFDYLKILFWGFGVGVGGRGMYSTLTSLGSFLTPGLSV